MAEKINFLSWNIQKYGNKKLNDDFTNYVVELINNSKADIVGIMEIVGWTGEDVKERLLTALGKAAWAGEASEMTPSRPYEQYLYLWKKSKIDVESVKTYGIVGEGDLSEVYTLLGLTTESNQIAFNKAMISDKWLDQNFEVNIKQFIAKGAVKWVSNKWLLYPKKFTITGYNPPLLTVAIKTKILNLFISVAESGDIFGKSARPPFLINAEVKANNEKFVGILFHAPGPGDLRKYVLTNALGMLSEVLDNDNIIIMGDFNIKENQQKNTWVALHWPDKQGLAKEVRKVPNDYKTREYIKPFQTFTGAQLSNPSSYPDFNKITFKECEKLFASDVKTSLKKTPATNPGGLVTMADLKLSRAESYDNFFVLPKGKSSETEVWSAIGEMLTDAKVVNPRGDIKPYSKSCADNSRAFFQSYKKQLVVPYPYDLKAAKEVYYRAISDHLPILTTVSLGP